MRRLAAIVVLLAACEGGPPTEIVAVADTDLRGPDAIDAVVFEVQRPGGEVQSSEAPWSAGHPAFVGIVHDGGSLGPIEVRAIGMRGRTEVVARRARVSFVEARTVMLRLDLFARCVGEGTCGAEETCAEGGCRSVEVEPDELAGWTGAPSGIDGGATIEDAAIDGGIDASVDGGCASITEACNGADDDCDGMIDETFSLATDPMNCGACGHACAGACTARTCADDPVAVAIGGAHACAVNTEGVAHCWGDNGDGQLGDGTVDPSATPSPVYGVVIADELAAGQLHTCTRAAGRVWCWGRGDRGQLGNGGTSSTTPQQIIGPTSVVSICAGDSHTCIVEGTGVASCFGDNADGQTASVGGSPTPRPAPLAVPMVHEVACGARHSCAIASADRRLYCWGNNDFGQLGRTDAGGVAPMEVPGLTGAVSVTAGREHTCVLRDDGRVQCFGSNAEGQLGTGTAGEGPTLRYVAELTDAIAIAAGDLHTCAVREDGLIFCWGRRSEGAVGDGMDGTPALVPAAVVDISDAARVYAGADATCARRAGARLSCWGTMSRSLGDGTTTTSPTPLEVTLP